MDYIYIINEHQWTEGSTWQSCSIPTFAFTSLKKAKEQMREIEYGVRCGSWFYRAPGEPERTYRITESYMNTPETKGYCDLIGRVTCQCLETNHFTTWSLYVKRINQRVYKN
jgi:hypothetical protein